MKRPLPTHLYTQRTSVYRNLNAKCLSVMQQQTVKGHAVTVVLENVLFRVQEGGRQAVLRTKRKRVHAFVDGTLIQCSEKELIAEIANGEPVQVTYNPYKAGYFYERQSGEPVHKARICVVTPSGISAYL